MQKSQSPINSWVPSLLKKKKSHGHGIQKNTGRCNVKKVKWKEPIVEINCVITVKSIFYDLKGYSNRDLILRI